MHMKYKLITTIGAGIAFVSSMLGGCSSDESGGGSGRGSSSTTCWPTHPSCGTSAGARTGPGGECVAWVDNAGATKLTYRMSQLQIVKPDILAAEFLQNNVVSANVSLNMPQCYQEGTGTFTWLMELDMVAKTGKTGGAHVQRNPAAGYCYINDVVEGFQTNPMEISIETTKRGAATVFDLAESIPDLTVAIFLREDESSAVILPLHQVMIAGAEISPDGNCIGRWMGDELDFGNNCKPDRTMGQKTQWISGATLTGYIDAEESDRVWIPDLSQTLCVALSGSGSRYGEEFSEDGRKGARCKRENGRILAVEKADWCASTNTACSPPEADSFRLEGTFAASAVKILDACP